MEFICLLLSLHWSTLDTGVNAPFHTAYGVQKGFTNSHSSSLTGETQGRRGEVDGAGMKGTIGLHSSEICCFTCGWVEPHTFGFTFGWLTKSPEAQKTVENKRTQGGW